MRKWDWSFLLGFGIWLRTSCLLVLQDWKERRERVWCEGLRRKTLKKIQKILNFERFLECCFWGNPKKAATLCYTCLEKILTKWKNHNSNHKSNHRTIFINKMIPWSQYCFARKHHWLFHFKKFLLLNKKKLFLIVVFLHFKRQSSFCCFQMFFSASFPHSKKITRDDGAMLKFKAGGENEINFSLFFHSHVFVWLVVSRTFLSELFFLFYVVAWHGNPFFNYISHEQQWRDILWCFDLSLEAFAIGAWIFPQVYQQRVIMTSESGSFWGSFFFLWLWLSCENK